MNNEIKKQNEEQMRKSHKETIEGLAQIERKLLELKQLILDNPNYEELDNQIEKELEILQMIDDGDEFFEEVMKDFN